MAEEVGWVGRGAAAAALVVMVEDRRDVGLAC